MVLFANLYKDGGFRANVHVVVSKSTIVGRIIMYLYDKTVLPLQPKTIMALKNEKMEKTQLIQEYKYLDFVPQTPNPNFVGHFVHVGNDHH